MGVRIPSLTPALTTAGWGSGEGLFPFEMSILEELPTTSGGDRRHPQDKWALPEDEGVPGSSMPFLEVVALVRQVAYSSERFHFFNLAPVSWGKGLLLLGLGRKGLLGAWDSCFGS